MTPKLPDIPRFGETKIRGTVEFRLRLFMSLLALVCLASVTMLASSPGASANECNGTGGGGGYCPAEFSFCGPGDSWCTWYDTCTGGGGGGGVGGGTNYGQWVPVVHSSAERLYYSRTTTSYPLGYSNCNQGWQNASALDTAIRSIIEGQVIRNVQHRAVCVRVPAEDWCNRFVCYSLYPYAWNTRNDWRWEQYQ